MPTPWQPGPGFVPRLGRPELVVPGTPCATPAFEFVSQTFTELASPPHPWANRVKNLFKKSESCPVQVNAASVTPPRKAPVVSLVDPVQAASVVQEVRPRRLLMVIRRRAYPGFNFMGPCSGVSDPTSDEEDEDDSFLELKRAHKASLAQPVDQEKVAVITVKVSETVSPDSPPNSDLKRAKRLSHTRQQFVLDGQQPPLISRPLAQRLLNRARDTFKVKTIALVN